MVNEAITMYNVQRSLSETMALNLCRN